MAVLYDFQTDLPKMHRHGLKTRIQFLTKIKNNQLRQQFWIKAAVIIKVE